MFDRETFGLGISSVLEELEFALLEYEAFAQEPVGFSDDAFRSIIRLFAASLLERSWNLQEKENMDHADRLAMAVKCGQEIRRIVKVFANIDSYQL